MGLQPSNIPCEVGEPSKKERVKVVDKVEGLRFERNDPEGAWYYKVLTLWSNLSGLSLPESSLLHHGNPCPPPQTDIQQRL